MIPDAAVEAAAAVTPAEAAFELPEQMRQILEQADAARENAKRKALEQWLKRMKA